MSLIRKDDDFFTRMVLSGAFGVTDKFHKTITISKVLDDQEGKARLLKVVNDIKAAFK